MSLRLNWGHCPAYHEIVEQNRIANEHPHDFAWGTDTFAVGTVMMMADRDTVDADLFARWMLWETANGAAMFTMEGRDATPEQSLLIALAHDGMTANITDKTLTAWNKRLGLGVTKGSVYYRFYNMYAKASDELKAKAVREFAGRNKRIEASLA